MTAELFVYALLGGAFLLLLAVGGAWANRYDAAHREARWRNRK